MHVGGLRWNLPAGTATALAGTATTALGERGWRQNPKANAPAVRAAISIVRLLFFPPDIRIRPFSRKRPMMRSLPFHTDTENAGDHSRPPASFLVPGRRTHRRAFRRDAFPSFPLPAVASGGQLQSHETV